MRTKRIGRGEGFFWLAMGISICVVAIRTGVGPVKEPGPGFIALAAGLFMAGVGLVMAFIALLGTVSIRNARWLPRMFSRWSTPGLTPNEGEDGKRRSGSALRKGIEGLTSISWSRVLCTVGLLFAYAILLDRLGHVPATFLVMWGLFYDRDKKNLVMSLLLSLLVTGISYLFFEKLLLVRFPRGIWP